MMSAHRQARRGLPSTDHPARGVKPDLFLHFARQSQENRHLSYLRGCVLSYSGYRVTDVNTCYPHPGQTRCIVQYKSR